MVPKKPKETGMDVAASQDVQDDSCHEPVTGLDHPHPWPQDESSHDEPGRLHQELFDHLGCCAHGRSSAEPPRPRIVAPMGRRRVVARGRRPVAARGRR